MIYYEWDEAIEDVTEGFATGVLLGVGAVAVAFLVWVFAA